MKNGLGKGLIKSIYKFNLIKFKNKLIIINIYKLRD